MDKTSFGIVLCLFSLLVICYTRDTQSRNPKQLGVKRPKCLSRDCIAASHRLFEYMDDKVDPCEDFNQFACGGFIKNKIIPDDKGRWDVFAVLTKDIEYHGRRLLEEAIDDKIDFESYKKAKKYYKSCMNEERQNELGVEPLKKLLNEAGGWPVVEGDKWDGTDFNIWDQSVKLNAMGYSSDYFAGASISADAKNNTHRVLHFDQASLGLSKEYLDKGLDEPEVKAYAQYMIDVAMLLGVEEKTAKEEMQKVLEFEMRLANISAPKSERRNKTKLYNPTTLGEFPRALHMTESWTTYMQRVLDFGGDKELTIEDSERVIIYDPNFYKNLSSVLNSTDQRTMANYAGWRMASATMNYLSSEAREIRQKYRKAITGIGVEPPRWKSCISAVGFNSYSKSNFIYAVSSMYAKHIFDSTGKKEVIEMTQYLRKAFSKLVDDLTWMDEETKVEARKKLKNMRQFLAFPDEFLDQEKVDGIYSPIGMEEDAYLKNVLKLSKFFTKYYALQLREPVDPDDWREHRYVAVVNAFYNPSLNNFEFPAGILQGTFFNAKVPKYLNYGGIGFIIGHEITHGFDDQGRQRDSNGALVDWWKPETSKNYKNRAQCVIWQFGNYTSKQVNLPVNGINTQGENIADMGGMKEAYMAYNMWEEENGVEPGLPGHSYTPRQLFWIAVAQNWCVVYRDEKLKNQILTGQHAPSEFRILGPLSNNQDFARDFECKKGSNMNPEKKCQVW